MHFSPQKKEKGVEVSNQIQGRELLEGKLKVVLNLIGISFN